MTGIISMPDSNKTFKAKPFSRWDAFVKQFQKDHPEFKDKSKNPSAKRKKENDK